MCARSGNNPVVVRVCSYEAATMRAINPSMRPRMERAIAPPPKGTGHESCSACVRAGCSLDAARRASAALYAVHVRPEDRALTANPQMTPQPEGMFHGAGECGVDRAVPVWRANGQALGYECLNNANGS